MSLPEIHFTKKHFKLEWFSGSGAGGQSRNKNMMCCRIKHLETGLTAQSQEHKSQVQNQKTAFERLVKMLLTYYAEDPEGRRDNQEVIRNYHSVRNEVHDKASGLKMEYKNIVDKGDLEPMINARRSAMMDVDFHDD